MNDSNWISGFWLRYRSGCPAQRHFWVAILALALISSLAASCNSPKHLIGRAYRQMNEQEKAMSDSMLLYALDHEAIYSLVDTLKPMSSVRFYRLPLLSPDPVQRDSAQRALNSLAIIAEKMSTGDWQFILQPFERSDSIYKNVEIYVIRRLKMRKMIGQHIPFYSSLGIAPLSDPAAVLAVTEYEQKYRRWQSYGYLFGYPDYAVDFFVQAGKSQDSTGTFVKRNFFAIPVYTGKTGHFTYAIPQGHQTGAVDSAIYSKAVRTLNRYSLLRQKYTVNHKTRAFRIFQKMN